jgi:hypothetical protein
MMEVYPWIIPARVRRILVLIPRIRIQVRAAGVADRIAVQEAAKSWIVDTLASEIGGAVAIGVATLGCIVAAGRLGEGRCLSTAMR